MNSKPAAVSNGAWILDHLLALLTLGSCLYVLWLFKTVDLEAPIEQLRLPPYIVLAGTLSVIAAIVFWIRMFADFARQRPQRHAALWGLALLIGAHLTALVYFVVIWRPRHRPR